MLKFNKLFDLMLRHPAAFFYTGGLYVFLLKIFFPQLSIICYVPGIISMLGLHPLLIGILSLKTGVLRYRGDITKDEYPRLVPIFTWILIVLGILVTLSFTVTFVISLISTLDA